MTEASVETVAVSVDVTLDVAAASEGLVVVVVVVIAGGELVVLAGSWASTMTVPNPRVRTNPKRVAAVENFIMMDGWMDGW